MRRADGATMTAMTVINGIVQKKLGLLHNRDSPNFLFADG